ncbi:hypothetical protein AGRO_4252 [Agrobacterium sp. ATCC 31749]|nr:hypothetical protein AGRO_4252 [Agrobacterium sp. ATCC 31749]
MPARLHARSGKLAASRCRRCDAGARAHRKAENQGAGGAEQPGSPASCKVLMH